MAKSLRRSLQRSLSSRLTEIYSGCPIQPHRHAQAVHGESHRHNTICFPRSCPMEVHSSGSLERHVCSKSFGCPSPLALPSARLETLAAPRWQRKAHCAVRQLRQVQVQLLLRIMRGHGDANSQERAEARRQHVARQHLQRIPYPPAICLLRFRFDIRQRDDVWRLFTLTRAAPACTDGARSARRSACDGRTNTRTCVASEFDVSRRAMYVAARATASQRLTQMLGLDRQILTPQGCSCPPNALRNCGGET
jgi:hypothetical protein